MHLQTGRGKKKINSLQQQHKHKNIAEKCHHDQNKTQEGSKHVKEKLSQIERKFRLSTKTEMKKMK